MTGFIQSTIKNTRSLSMQNKAGATATTMNYLYDLVGGLLVAATSSSTRATIAGVANQTTTGSESPAITQIPVIDLDSEDTFVVDSTNNSDPLHNGQLMVLGANAYTVNNTGTTDAAGIVKQVGTFGAPSEKKIIVSFVAL
jgi:hypothetical protein